MTTLLTHLRSVAVTVATLVFLTLTPTRARSQVSVWLTKADQTALLQQGSVSTSSQPSPNTLVQPDVRYQTMVGFGAAITDASADLIKDSMSESQRTALLTELFGPPPNLNLSFARIPIGATDFSTFHYSLDDTPNNQPDPNLNYFSVSNPEYSVFPTARRALAINPKLVFMATPFSAPAWMKDNGSLYGGQLKQEYYSVYAQYLIKFLWGAYYDGVPISYLTIQNEPLYEPSNYPGMRFNWWDRSNFYRYHIGPQLQAIGSGTKLLELDHNWEDYQDALYALGNGGNTKQWVAGIGWHCYGGDVSQQRQVQDAYPDIETFFTECSGTTDYPSWQQSLIWTVRNVIIGSTRNWAKGVSMWNLALDQYNGPHTGGCGTCRGLVTIDRNTGQVTRNLEYYAFAHASRFVHQGARRVESTANPVSGVDTVAFRNEDDGSVVLIALNGNSYTSRITVDSAGTQFAYDLPEYSVATFVWQ